MALILGGVLVVGGAGAVIGSAAAAVAAYKYKKYKEAGNAKIIGENIEDINECFFNETKLLRLIDLCCRSLESNG